MTKPKRPSWFFFKRLDGMRRIRYYGGLCHMLRYTALDWKLYAG